MKRTRKVMITKTTTHANISFKMFIKSFLKVVHVQLRMYLLLASFTVAIFLRVSALIAQACLQSDLRI